MAEGYKGVECQSLAIEDDLTEKEKNKQILEKRLEKYLLTCKTLAPYPLNYLGFSEDTKFLAIIIGLMIDEDLLFCGKR